MAELIQSIELSSLTLLKCDFEILNPKEAPNGGSVEFSCEVAFIGNEIESNIENELEITLNFEIRGFREEENLFRLKQTFDGTFQVLNNDTFTDTPKELRAQYCVSLLYPTVRENAHYILNKAGLGQIEIPLHFSTIDIEEVES